MAGSWRMARSLNQLIKELDRVYPDRSKKSDGGIGDHSHTNRASDHNPWAPPPRGGVVTARDITHDPNGGVDCSELANHLRKRAMNGDKRIKYIIWDYRIASATSGWAWRRYPGKNPHTSHLHVSVAPILSLADHDAGWGIVKDSPAGKSAPSKIGERWTTFYKGAPGARIVKLWDCGKDVEMLQRFIGGIADDGYFGKATEDQVREYQRMRGLNADGVVGPKTWAPILKALGISK